MFSNCWKISGAALVGRKPPREADGQRVGIQQMIERDEVAVGQTLLLNQQPPPRKFDQFAPQLIAQGPELLIGDELRVRQALPELRRVELGRPVLRRARESRPGRRWRSRRQLAPPEPADGPFHPAEQVNAVGDMADGDLLDRLVRIQAMPHVPADAPMQFADGIGRAGELQRQHRHAKRLLVVLRIDPAQLHQLGERRRHLRAEPVQRIVHQIRAEAVMAGLHWRMRRENAFGLRLASASGKLFPAAIFSRAKFQRQEGSVPFVHVEH